MKKEISCGTIIVDDGKVLMIKQVNENVSFGFPKGHMENGETQKETALRETKEETNLDVEIISDKKYTMSYIIKEDILKEVNLFLAKIKTKQELIKQDQEISEICWVDIDKVSSYIKYQNTLDLWNKVYKDIKK